MDEEKVSKIVSVLDMLIDDSSVPRNVRSKIGIAKQKLAHGEDDSARLSGAVYALDEIGNDINLPMHARTLVWNVISELEAMK